MTTYTLLVACCNLAARSATTDPHLALETLSTKRRDDVLQSLIFEAILKSHYHIIPCDRWAEARTRLGSHLT